ncbi:CDC42 Rho GTPase-activating protein [Phaffia rhodozyma]|uniref:CDC42 Rho GTPase-activating protein n=1 Tax=Phaffia rhodozyma TaxID=264483 RepID=A0A0F7SPI3_PHARH|nr:CDC42 Rho GTPase-activating protein [Phaffia rhodozyma]
MSRLPFSASTDASSTTVSDLGLKLSSTTSTPSPASTNKAATGAFLTMPSSSFNHPFPSLSSVSSWTSFGSSRIHATSSSSDYQEIKESIEPRLRRLVWQAGLDEFGRPIICFSIASIPDPRSVDLEKIFRRLVSTLQPLVENDYNLVIFAAGGSYYPSFSWIWKVWAQLGRPFRKNLKQLFIVHPNFKTKAILTLATPLISAKVFRKIIYIQKLSLLFSHLPIGNILIPPETVRENLAREPSYLPSPLPPRTLNTQISQEFPLSTQYVLPSVIQDSVQYLRWGYSEDVDYYGLRSVSSPPSEALTTSGIFRKNPSSGVQRCVEEAYLVEQPVSLTLFDDPHLAAGLIKLFFRKLKEPLFGKNIWDLVTNCPDCLDSQPGERYLNDIILGSLNPYNRLLLGYVIYLLHETMLCNSLMTSRNLSIVFTPNLIRSNSPTRDMLLASVEPSASLAHLAALEGSGSNAPLKEVTLGLIVAHWIERPQVFWEDEVRNYGRGSRVTI